MSNRFTSISRTRRAEAHPVPRTTKRGRPVVRGRHEALAILKVEAVELLRRLEADIEGLNAVLASVSSAASSDPRDLCSV